MACPAAPRRRPVARMRIWLPIALGIVLGGCQAPEPVSQSAAPTPAEPPAPVQSASTPPDFEKLQRLTAAELLRLLGEPDFRRQEPPAEVWQYRGADCVLDLFLYRDPSGVRVAHTEMRERTLVQSGHCRGGDGFARLSRESRL
jgi:hypothetical protein